jgi:hypothetical protein
MFTYIPLDKDTLSQETITNFAKYEGRNELFETKAFSIIEEEQYLKYLEALKFIFSAYKFPTLHISNINYIIGQHVFIYSVLQEKRADALEAAELLLFLKRYHLQNKEFERKLNDSKNEGGKKLKRYVEFKTSYATEHPIKLNDIHYIALGIFRLLKSQSYIHLQDTLEPYDEIPSYTVVKELINENLFVIDYPEKYLLAELSIELLNYLSAFKVSNKYRFIFDLLFISQVFHLNSKATSDIQSLANNNRFDPSGIIPTIKTSYIKDILKTYKIYIKRNR